MVLEWYDRRDEESEHCDVVDSCVGVCMNLAYNDLSFWISLGFVKCILLNEKQTEIQDVNAPDCYNSDYKAEARHSTLDR